MNYYERLIKCKHCDHQMRLSATWRPNRVGKLMEDMWVQEFAREHEGAKHNLEIVFLPWKKGL